VFWCVAGAERLAAANGYAVLACFGCPGNLNF
jgi:hypothetical protein